MWHMDHKIWAQIKPTINSKTNPKLSKQPPRDPTFTRSPKMA